VSLIPLVTRLPKIQEESGRHSRAKLNPLGSTLDRETENEGGLATTSAVSAHLSIDAQRQRLPIYKHRNKLLWCIEKYQCVIVVGQTGCGKSTRKCPALLRHRILTAEIPQYLHEAGWTNNNLVVACTQPRRVAATSVATRVAEEVGTVLGDEVGYSIRFEDLSNPERTRIKYLTDGMLFREIMVDPLLSRYSVIMVRSFPFRRLFLTLD
jgi:ATP-dependent RNA helicase DDX35